MKIAILGNGKMGKRISELAQVKGDEIVLVSSSKIPATTLNLSIADVAIDFSTPNSAFENISHAINSGIPVVSGTTAWLEKMQDIEKLCIERNGAFLYASNFSLGMNIFFELNKKLAELIKYKEPNYLPFSYGTFFRYDIKKVDDFSQNIKKLRDRCCGCSPSNALIKRCF